MHFFVAAIFIKHSFSAKASSKMTNMLKTAIEQTIENNAVNYENNGKYLSTDYKFSSLIA